MTTAELVDNRVETYLGRLDAALSGVVPSQKIEILSEIRAHILDSVEGAADHDGAVDRVLRMLGTPEDLAERYTTECLLTRASSSFSPWLLLRTCWRWSVLGIKGTLAFLLAVIGYSMALALTLCVFLKPIMPSRIGMWVGPEGLNIGVTAHPEIMHEVLGQWFVPVIAVMAAAVAIGTTHGLRWIIRRRTPKPAF